MTFGFYIPTGFKRAAATLSIAPEQSPTSSSVSGPLLQRIRAGDLGAEYIRSLTYSRDRVDLCFNLL